MKIYRMKNYQHFRYLLVVTLSVKKVKCDYKVLSPPQVQVQFTPIQYGMKSFFLLIEHVE